MTMFYHQPGTAPFVDTARFSGVIRGHYFRLARQSGVKSAPFTGKC